MYLLQQIKTEDISVNFNNILGIIASVPITNFSLPYAANIDGLKKYYYYYYLLGK